MEVVKDKQAFLWNIYDGKYFRSKPNPFQKSEKFMLE